MKLTSSVLVVLLVLFANSKRSGYEGQLDSIVNYYKVLIDEMEQSFARVTFYFDNLEVYEDSSALLTPVFADNLSFTIMTLFGFKDVIYSSLRQLAILSNEIVQKQKNFDLWLSPKDKSLLLFVSTLPEADIPPVLRKIFLDFKSQRNLLSVSVQALNNAIQSNVVNTVNLYDLLEEFANDISKASGKREFGGVTEKDVAQYGYIIGFLTELRKLYQQYQSLLDKINQYLLATDQYVKGFDSALESMSFYYQKRFVEGVSDEQLSDPSQPYSLDVGEGKRERAEKPKPLCDKILLNNFGVEDGFTLATAVSPYERLPLCFELTSSCCSADLVQSTYRQYMNSDFQVLKRKYELISALLTDISAGYSQYNKYAYSILGATQLSRVCESKLKELMFMPISRDFFVKFRSEFNKAKDFSLKAKSNIFCFVCDQKFHRNAIESGTIVLTKSFCSALTASSLEFYRMYHAVIVGYVNSVLEAVQCQQQTGEYLNEFTTRLQSNSKLLNSLNECAKESKSSYCEALCERFSFHSLESDLDLDIESLEDIHEFLAQKNEELSLAIESSLDMSLKSVLLAEYSLQRQSSLGNRSFENLRLVFVDEESESKGASNPLTHGELIVQKGVN